eukprot:CAMPEP_0197241078 /NCGR_PEP_ID=MMETSP1429-20130617/7201_1 /TAXON_ID=49237 /ORGANISM="Chaetoceros  sp., Strain UNC1202" /LENGTH=194 /DNA_ID=CAMNT_0042700845 /DNA_START=339 /DNA_END=923 /DNA_ORIENTATION=+
MQMFFLYFVHDMLAQTKETRDASDAVALLAMIGQTAAAVTCYPVGLLSDKVFGGQRRMFVYTACILLGSGFPLLLFCHKLGQMIYVVVLIGAANGIYLTMDTSLAVDTLGTDEKNENEDENVAAQLLGVWGVFGCFGSALGPLIGAIIMNTVGKYDVDHGKFYSVEGYRWLFTFTALFFLCSAYSLSYIRKEGV